MRYTVTSELDPELFAELERERSASGLSRSAAIRQAVEWWIVHRRERGEERVGRAEGRHRQVMNRLDFVVGMIREQERRERVAGKQGASPNGERPAGGFSEGSLEGSPEESGNGSGDDPGNDSGKDCALWEWRDGRKTGSSGGEGVESQGAPRRGERSALEEARKRARRRTE